MRIVKAAGVCEFVMVAANTAHIAEWLNRLNGWDMAKAELLQVGERIANMCMAIAIREGGNRRKRHVPERAYGGPGAVLPEGPPRMTLHDVG